MNMPERIEMVVQPEDWQDGLAEAKLEPINHHAGCCVLAQAAKRLGYTAYAYPDGHVNFVNNLNMRLLASYQADDEGEYLIRIFDLRMDQNSTGMTPTLPVAVVLTKVEDWSN